MRVQERITTLLLLLTTALLTGCQNTSDTARNTRYDTLPAGQSDANTQLARKHHERGLLYYEDGDMESAIAALKDALTADVTYGPAHNSLGTVYYEQKRFYLAAWEFQYAAKLMPRTPEPKNNLGLVFEAVGDLTEANTHYAEAYRLAPDDVQIMGNYLRSKIRSGDHEIETKRQLKDFLLRETRPDWLAWANRTLGETHWE